MAAKSHGCRINGMHMDMHGCFAVGRGRVHVKAVKSVTVSAGSVRCSNYRLCRHNMSPRNETYG